jgi:hypothetical protein
VAAGLPLVFSAHAFRNCDWPILATGHVSPSLDSPTIAVSEQVTVTLPPVPETQ